MKGLLLLKPQSGEGAEGSSDPTRKSRSRPDASMPDSESPPAPTSSLFIGSPSPSCPRREAEAGSWGEGQPPPPAPAGGGVPREAKRGAVDLPAGADGD